MREYIQEAKTLHNCWPLDLPNCSLQSETDIALIFIIFSGSSSCVMVCWDEVLIMVVAWEPTETCSNLSTEYTSNEAKVCQYEGADENFIMNKSYSSANGFQAEEKDLCQVCLQNGSHWMEFHEIRYLRFFWKSVEKCKSD